MENTLYGRGGRRSRPLPYLIRILPHCFRSPDIAVTIFLLILAASEACEGMRCERSLTMENNNWKWYEDSISGDAASADGGARTAQTEGSKEALRLGAVIAAMLVVAFSGRGGRGRRDARAELPERTERARGQRRSTRQFGRRGHRRARVRTTARRLPGITLSSV